jgi:acetylornithine deacetylase/succinyl-diaminopimelate desuccinylase-like protein
MGRAGGPWDPVLATVPEPDQIEYLRQILAIPSAGGEEGALARFVAGSLQASGIEAALHECLPERPAVVGRLPGAGGGPSLMLLAHLDVPTLAPGWRRDPFRPVVQRGRIYGAGVRDMKAGLAAMVMAFRAVHRARVPLQGDLLLVAVPGHMEQGVGAKRLFDAGVTADLVLVGEPTGLDLLSTHLGWAVMELEVQGRETSTVTAGDGVNALEGAATVIRGLRGVRFRPAVRSAYVRRFLPATPCYLSPVEIRGGNPYYPNIVPGRCTLTVDVRFVPGKPPAEILREVEARLGTLRRRDPALRVTARLKYGFALQPVLGRPEDPLLRLTADVVRWARGAEPELRGFFYTTDGGVFQDGGGSATVVCGPGRGSLRAPDEWVAVREYVQATAIYARIALETAGRSRADLAAAYPPPARPAQARRQPPPAGPGHAVSRAGSPRARGRRGRGRTGGGR